MKSPSASTTSFTDGLRWTPYETRFGVGWIGWRDDGVIVETRLPGRGDGLGADPVPPAAVTDMASALSGYFAGRGTLPYPDPPLSAQGSTDLDRVIYDRVTAIPPGSTMTYAEVAAAAGRPGAARAVGAAMARNRLAPLIPCHRVVGSDGSLRGYAGGIDMKHALLEMERRHA